MEYELIAKIIFFGSLIGIGVIIFRKAPVLVELPDQKPLTTPTAAVSWYKNLAEKVKILNPFKSFSYEVFLQKILSKIRILSLKADSKTFNWLQKLRERAQKKKTEENDNYWEEIKKSTKK